MQNYHRHTSYSNILTPDSATMNVDYAKRAVELGHKIICSMEHGWQGYYFECYELAKKYNLKFVFGSEVYWVKDRQKEYFVGLNKKGKEVFAKDKSNCHAVVLSKNENGRQSINDMLSEANETGYYYKPRVDIELLLQLPPEDVFVTTACIAFNKYDDIDDIIKTLHNHFRNNFMLEIQYHNTDKQKEWNKHLKEVGQRYGIELIVGLDSHFIYESDSWKRDSILQAKNTFYEDEVGWYNDYPSDDVVMQRFLEQGIFTKDEIQKAMDNTDIVLTFDDYDDVPIFNKEIKLPTLYPNLSMEEKNSLYRKIIGKKFVEYMKSIPKERYQEYYEGVSAEIKTYEDTGMVDYPLLDYEIVKDAVEHGGLITDTGRGSAVGFLTNTLCGFSKVDRFTSAIKLYPERFISTTRILETHSLPDIDLNVGTPEIFEESQVRVLGENHAYPMIAFGTLKKKSAFKLYAKAAGLDFQLANTISEQIGMYDEAVKKADEEEKEYIDLFDYVDRKYEQYIEKSKEYWGIVSDKKKAPSAYLLYQGDIRREIGLIKCKSETTKKEYITCVIDGAIAENYKFLKNDILKVDVVLLIDKVFKRIGIEHFNVNQLLKLCENDKKTWDLYANGFTIGINQVEQDGSKKKCMRYKPRNISELSAFVAAIRPGFKSMYSRFEKREEFSYNLPSLDNLIQTKQFPYSYMIYQENIMSVLHYAGFPMDQCYGIIKAIAKKHPEKVLPLKSKFIEGFKNRIIEDEKINEEEANKHSTEVWQIINDNVSYSFNSSHAYSVALDSLYQAWQKANYPYEFYETLLQHYSDKGKKDKVAELKKEMKKAFGISEGAFKFRNDNRTFRADKENKTIHTSLVSIKGVSQKTANSLYNLGFCKYDSWFDFLEAAKKEKINAQPLDILTKLDYFSEFGEIDQLLYLTDLYEKFNQRKEFKKSDIESSGLTEDIIKKYAGKETAKLYSSVDFTKLLREYVAKSSEMKTDTLQKVYYQWKYLGYEDIIDGEYKGYCIVNSVNENYTPRLNVYPIANGNSLSVKISKKLFRENPVQEGDILHVYGQKKKNKRRLDENGDFVQIEDEFEWWITSYEIIKVKKDE